MRMIGTFGRGSRSGGGCLFWRDRRAGVALIAALAAPVMLMSVALGIEVAHWSVVQLDTQRIADTAVLAGGEAWVANPNPSQAAQPPSPCLTPSQACLAAVAAANVAELNGAVGASIRGWSWNAAKTIGTLMDGAVTVIVNTASANQGVRNQSDPLVQVNVSEAVPVGFAQLFNVASTETLNATAKSEIESTQAWSGPQPCLAALKTAAQGGTGINFAGSAAVSAIGCSVRSNANIIETGSGYWDTEGIYAAGSVSLPSYFTPSDVTDNNGNPITPVSNAGAIPDPYATNAAIQQAFTNAAQSTNDVSITCPNPNSTWQNPSPCSLPNNGSYCTATTGSGTCTLVPGYYGSLNVISGGNYTFNLQPGMYYFNGNINLSNNTTTNGNGVTIVTTGTFVGVNTFYFNVNAPTAAQAAVTGGIAGVAIAGNSSSTTTNSSCGNNVPASTVLVCGDTHMTIGGVVYFPNGSFSGAGSASATGSSSESCFELLTGSIWFEGFSGYSGDCSDMGATSFGSTYQSSSLAALVQ